MRQWPGRARSMHVYERYLAKRFGSARRISGLPLKALAVVSGRHRHRPSRPAHDCQCAVHTHPSWKGTAILTAATDHGRQWGPVQPPKKRVARQKARLRRRRRSLSAAVPPWPRPGGGRASLAWDTTAARIRVASLRPQDMSKSACSSAIGPTS